MYYIINTVMIDFTDFKPNNDSPIYQQILDYVKKRIISGDIADGDELPSRRKLSALLGINPNTVQKAFAILEEEKLIESSAGAKSIVCLDSKKIAVVKTQILSTEINKLIDSMVLMGISKDEAIAALGKEWEDRK